MVTWALCLTFILVSELNLTINKLLRNGFRVQQNMLPNYFNALRYSHCQEFIEDEELFRSNGFKCLSDDAL